MSRSRVPELAVKGWVLGVIAAVASCAASPQRGDTGIHPVGFDLWDVHCPSGMRVIFERAPGSNMVGVTTVVGVGSRADPPGRGKSVSRRRAP